eukprot:scaffold379_cov145-Skeletonema_menzelii.AAC.7
MVAKKFVRSSASALLLPFFVLCSVFEKRERGLSFGEKKWWARNVASIPAVIPGDIISRKSHHSLTDTIPSHRGSSYVTCGQQHEAKSCISKSCIVVQAAIILNHKLCLDRTRLNKLCRTARSNQQQCRSRA